jgi:modulator of FtsH protease HflC
MMRKRVTVVVAALLLGVLARLCVFTVDRTEFVYLTQFGRHVATYDGAQDEQAGLHFRWPWPIQSVLRIDRRLQVLDLPAAELVTKDPRPGGSVDKTLAIDAYVVWRVPNAEAVERYITRVGSVERAREILRDRFRDRLGAAIARTPLQDLISDRAGHVEQQREELSRQLMKLDRDSSSGPGGSGPADGIEVVDVRVRRLSYPEQVRRAIFDRIISERKRKSTYELSTRRTEADKIRIDTDTEISIKLVGVRARNREKLGSAQKRADETLNPAISKDRDYYLELKRREIGEAGLDVRKKVYSTWLFDFFFPRSAAPWMSPADAPGLPPRLSPAEGEGRREGGR